jgi:integrase
MQRGSLKKYRDKRTGIQSWRFQWRDSEGHPHTKILGACSKMSRAEAESARAVIMAGVLLKRRRVALKAETLADYIQNVYIPEAAHYWKKSTEGTCEQQIRDHITRPLGHRPLTEVTRIELQAYLDAMAAAGKSKSLVAHIRWHLNKIFRTAASDGLIAINPAPALRIPKCKAEKPKPVIDAFDIEAIELALALADVELGKRDQLIFRLAAVEGMRPGEIEGLQYGDIHERFVAPQQDLEVHLSVRRRRYRGITDTPKTKASIRDVPLTQSTQRVLGMYTIELDDWSADAWLFPSKNPRRPINYSNIFRRRIKPMLDRFGFSSVNFQALRTSAVTELVPVEPDATVRSAILGHEVDVSENVYRQVSLDQKERAMRLREESTLPRGLRRQEHTPPKSNGPNLSTRPATHVSSSDELNAHPDHPVSRPDLPVEPHFAPISLIPAIAERLRLEQTGVVQPDYVSYLKIAANYRKHGAGDGDRTRDVQLGKRSDDWI